MEDSYKKETVYSVMSKIVFRLDQIQSTGSGKALLANLRNSIGREWSSTLDVWNVVFSVFPLEFLSKTGKMTNQEQAILTSLQLYALHQQGRTESVILTGEDIYWKNIGYSLSALRNEEDNTAVDRRFNSMITSSTFEELSHHLRQMMKLLKSKNKNSKVNYAKLANDLYQFLRGYREDIRISWAKAYYTSREKGEETYANK